MNNKLTILLTTLLASAAPTASAECWRNDDLTRLVETVAFTHFPDFVEDLPVVCECDPSELPPGVAAEYLPMDDAIHVSAWQRNLPSEGVWYVLAQSLAFALLKRVNADPANVLWVMQDRGIAVKDYDFSYHYEY